MIIINEKKVDAKNALKEAQFQYNAVKSFQVSGTRLKLSIEVDFARAIKSLQFEVPRDQLDPKYLGEVIAHQLDWNAHALSVDDNYELRHLLAELNDY